MALTLFLILLLLASWSVFANFKIYSYILFASMFCLKFFAIKIDHLWGGGASIVLILIELLIIPYLFLNLNTISVELKRLYAKIIFSIFLIFTYLFISALFKGLDPFVYVKFAKNLFYGYLLLFYYSSHKSTRIYNVVFNLLFLLLAFQVILGVLQGIGPNEISDFFKIYNYSWNGGTTHVLQLTNIYNRLVIGTLLKPAQFGNIVVLLLLYFFSKYFLIKNNFFTKKHLLILLLAVIASFLTGIRTPIASLTIGVSIILYFRNKKNLIAISIIAIMFITVIYPSISHVGSMALNREVGMENPLSRITGLFEVAKNINNLDEDNSLTLVRSIRLLPYISDAPLFGIGLYWKGGYGLLASGEVGASWSDSTLIFFIVEFGLFGLILFLYPLYLVLNFAKKQLTKDNYIIIMTLFIALFFQTITDQGIFNLLSSMIFLAIVGIELNFTRYKNEKK